MEPNEPAATGGEEEVMLTCARGGGKAMYPRTAIGPQRCTGDKIVLDAGQTAAFKAMYEAGMTVNEMAAGGGWSVELVKAAKKRLLMSGVLADLKKVAAGKMRSLADGMLDEMEGRMAEMPVEAMPGAVKILTEKALVLEGEAGSITETRGVGERRFTLAGLDERLKRMRKVEAVEAVEEVEAEAEEVEA